MAIRQISLNDFRNLKSLTLDLHDKFNVITGLNASGKTSFLEAIHIICKGRSFKSHQLNNCIQHNKSSFLLFALFENYKAGFSRTNSKTTIRINNETIHKISLLATKTPVRIINTSCFDLITGSPGVRREYIDWCLFHVEHSYLSMFLDFKHALKQRNALLKSKRNLSELDYWDEYLSNLSLQIYDFRSRYIQQLQSIFDLVFSDVLTETPIELIYDPGWDIETPLLDILKAQRTRDIKYGFSRYGVHRDDIKILCKGLSIDNTFSRGQIKKISILLLLAQLHLINEYTDKKVILLIDDLHSELDSLSVNYILKKLSNLNSQIFITNIDSSFKMLTEQQEYKLFHVEHGMIKAVKHTREHNVRI